VRGSALLEESVNTSDRELKSGASTTRDHLALRLSTVLARFAFSACHRVSELKLGKRRLNLKDGINQETNKNTTFRYANES
jgi:hypothetical protein